MMMLFTTQCLHMVVYGSVCIMVVHMVCTAVPCDELHRHPDSHITIFLAEVLPFSLLSLSWLVFSAVKMHKWPVAIFATLHLLFKQSS